MTALVEFLRARLDEDVAWALACSRKAGEIAVPFRADRRKVFSGGDVVAETDSANLAEHIARHDPARVLREVEAKRRIIDLATSLAEQAPAADDIRTLDTATGAVRALGDVLRLLASVYADHPDYRKEWQPA